MAKLKIYTFPDEVLTKRATEVDTVDDSFRTLSSDMFETMYDAPGIGLAANQVGILKRIVVVDVDYSWTEIEDGQSAPEGAPIVDGGYLTDQNPYTLINPVIVKKNGKIQFEEGCLSVPEYLAKVDRAENITVEFLDLDGKKQTIEADGLLAVCIQHEIDHLDGKLFIDRLSPLKRELAKKKLIKDRKLREEVNELPRRGRSKVL